VNKLYRLSCPAKTFLVGEYIALNGKPALLAATEPRFELEVQVDPNQENPFHPRSPAGFYWATNVDQFSQFRFNFKDPFNGAGGFGGSTAEFILLYTFHRTRQNLDTGSEFDLDLKTLVSEYRNLEIHQGSKPSGADLLAQAAGGLVTFERSSGLISHHRWPFLDKDFRLLATGIKLPTYEHLKSKIEFPEDRLSQLSQNCSFALQSGHWEDFSSAIAEYGSLLNSVGLQAPHTTGLIDKIKSEHSGLVAKGCGALGSDVVLVLGSNNDIASFEESFLKTHRIYGGRSQLTQGVLAEVKS
jgi:mevalonate kinase